MEIKRNILRNRNLIYIISLLIFTIFLNFIFRYKQYNSELGGDSFVYNILSNSILREDKIVWAINPLSLWGLYPASDSSGSPILIALIANILNISSINAILCYSIFVVILTNISIFLLCQFIFKNPIISSISATSFSLSPYFFYGTIWSLDERELAIGLMPFIILLLLLLKNMNSKQKIKVYITILLLFIVGISIHLITLLILPLFIIFYFIQYMKDRTFIHSYRLKQFVFFIMIIIILFIPFFISMISNNILFSWNTQYSKGSLFTGKQSIISLLNIPISIAGSTGLFSSILGGFGILALLLKKFKTNIDLSLLFILFCIYLFISMREYVKIIFSLILAILIGYGLYTIVILTKNKMITLSIILLIVNIPISYGFTSWRVNTFNADLPYHLTNNIEKDTENTALYMLYEKNSQYITNNDWDSVKISSINDIQALRPVSTPEQFYLNLLIYPNRLNITMYYTIEFKPDINNYKRPYQFISTTKDYYLDILAKNDINSMINLGIKSIVIDKRFPDKYSGYNLEHFYNSDLLKNISNYSFKIYEDNGWRIYSI